jgi:phage antirepressor YoqD-like protein
MSITDASKHFSLHPIKEVFPYLRDAGYLTARDLPTQAAIDAGYLALKETMSQDGRMFQQAVVETWQLENWRAHVVHQVKRWNQAIKPLKAR